MDTTYRTSLPGDSKFVQYRNSRGEHGVGRSTMPVAGNSSITDNFTVAVNLQRRPLRLSFNGGQRDGADPRCSIPDPITVEIGYPLPQQNLIFDYSRVRLFISKHFLIKT